MEKYETLVQVAKWYFLDGLGQAEIAKKIKKSRSMVSKMITEARSKNIVDIRINYPMSRNRDLEIDLANHLGLTEAWVVDATGTEELNSLMVAGAAAQCLARKLHLGMTLGMAWSRTLREVVQQFEPAYHLGVTVVQLSGSAALGEASLDGTELVRTLAEKLGGSHRYFPAPLVVRSKELADALIHEPMVQQSLNYAQKCDVAVLGVGTADLQENSLLQSKLLDKHTLQELMNKGAVGDILAHQLRSDGSLVDTDFNARVIGLTVEALKAIPQVLAVASGYKKIVPIYAAAAGGYFTTLVTDSSTARGLLQMQRLPDRDATTTEGVLA